MDSQRPALFAREFQKYREGVFVNRPLDKIRAFLESRPLARRERPQTLTKALLDAFVQIPRAPVADFCESRNQLSIPYVCMMMNDIERPASHMLI